jgi:hypothetical protein
MFWEDRAGVTTWNDAQQVIQSVNHATTLLFNEIL